MRHIRPICTFVLIILFLKAPFLNAQEQKLTPKNLKMARNTVAWNSRRVIMNNDGNDSRGAKEKTRKAFMESRTTPLAGTHVDAIFYCDGIWGTFTHRSPTADLRTGSDKRYLEWAVDLIKDGGPDPLGSMIDFGHKNDIEVFWSLRMNDTHDSADPSMLLLEEKIPKTSGRKFRRSKEILRRCKTMVGCQLCKKSGPRPNGRLVRRGSRKIRC